LTFRKLTARFGKLNNSELKLESGLNVIYGENESGKSTWCSFIRVMLYGIRTSDRDTATRLADKNRYLPWSGGTMEGRMELDLKGRRVVVERSSTRSGIMQGFSAYYADTGEPLEGYNGSNAGELLVGLSRDAFERSVFVGNAAIAVGSSDELERKIRSLASSGDEEVSFSGAYETLNKWQRERRFRKSGLLPEAEQEYAEVCRRLEESDSLAKRRIEAEGALAALSGETERLVRSINVKKASHAREEIKHIVETRELCTQKQETAKNAKNALVSNGFEVNRGYIARLRQAIRTVEDSSRLKGDTGGLAENAREYVRAAEAELSKFAEYKGRGPDEIETEAKADSAEAKVLAVKKVKGWLFILTALFIAAEVAVLLTPPGTWEYERYLGIIAVASSAGAFLSLAAGAMSITRVKKAKNRIAELCARHGCAGPADIEPRAGAYRDACLKREEAVNRAVEIEKRLAGISDGLSAADLSLGELLALAGWEREDFSGLEERLNDYEERINEWERASREAELAGVRYETMVSSTEMGILSREASFEGGRDDYPDRTVEEIQKRLEELDEAAAEKNKELTYVSTREAMLGDRAGLLSRKQQLEKDIERMTSEYEAIGLAAKTLEAANTELTGRLTPELNRRASTIFARFTGGRYLDVKIKKGFEALAGDGSAAAMRSILALSSGTADQLYLALRLAVSSMLFSTDMPPLILDDCFVCFDDRRLGSALEYLKEEAMLRQILLFTCHEREVNRLRQDPEVNIIAI